MTAQIKNGPSTDTPSRRRAGRFFWNTFLTCVLLDIAICTFSVILPHEFFAIVTDVCGYASGCLPPDLFSDQAILTPLGYERYAIGFVALRRLSAITVLVEIIALSAVAISVDATRDSRFSPLTVLGATFISAAGSWQLFLNRDFLFAADGEVGGYATPPLGSFIVIAAELLLVMLASILIAWLLRLAARGGIPR